MKSAVKALSMALCAAFVLTPLAASSDEPFDIQSQVGPNPVLPDIQQYLFPPMHLASVVGWKNGEKPTVAAGLKIEALASDLQHPRSLYTLPNGDVLVVESKAPPPQPITRPKDIVMRFIEKGVTSGGDPGPSNRITLLRYDPAGGKPPTRSVFLDHLHSPFGVVLVGEDLYVANTDAIVRYPYHDGDQTISASGVTLTPAAGRPDRSPLDEEPDGQSRRLAALCRRRLQQQHHRERHRSGEKSRCDLGSRSRERTLAHFCKRPPQPERTDLRAGERRALDRRQRARRTRPGPGPGLPDVRERRRLLWMALQLLRPTPRSARAAAAPGSGREGHRSRLRAKLARGAAGPRFLHCRQPATKISRRRVRRRTRKLGPADLQRLQGRFRALQRRASQWQS